MFALKTGAFVAQQEKEEIFLDNPFYLVFVCLVAFTMVMSVLAFLALAMSWITRLLPAPVSEEGGDPAMVAAMASVVASQFGGARVIDIKEVK